MRKVKIWTSEDQILAEIERLKKRASKLVVKARELSDKAAALFGQLEEIRFALLKGDLSTMEFERLEAKERSTEISAASKKQEAEEAANLHRRIMESTLPRMKEILAGFRTQTMPEITGEYRGIAVR